MRKTPGFLPDLTALRKNCFRAAIQPPPSGSVNLKLGRDRLLVVERRAVQQDQPQPGWPSLPKLDRLAR
jgi:hypothetical protein